MEKDLDRVLSAFREYLDLSRRRSQYASGGGPSFAEVRIAQDAYEAAQAAFLAKYGAVAE